MNLPIELDFASSLDADADAVWRFVSTMTGVNFELHPFVHMTTGGGHHSLPTEVTAGQVIFKSWILLFHVLPFDRHALALDQIDEGRGFVEESTSWLHLRWRHERRVTPLDHGCLVTDRLAVSPRVRRGRPVVSFVVEQLFAHRHRRLRRRFGAAAVACQF